LGLVLDGNELEGKGAYVLGLISETLQVASIASTRLRLLAGRRPESARNRMGRGDRGESLPLFNDCWSMTNLPAIKRCTACPLLTAGGKGTPSIN
jgi:hypothetical protein